MSKHTPGPWIVGNDEDSDYCLVGPPAFAEVVTDPVVKLHYEPDARLIAAAPDLLEFAMRVCYGEGDDIRSLISQGIEAIQKATGEKQ